MANWEACSLPSSGNQYGHKEPFINRGELTAMQVGISIAMPLDLASISYLN